MPTVKELTDELRRLGGTGYSGKKKAELEVMLAEVKQFWASRKAPAPAAEAPKKAAEAAPAPPSAHAESMAKKAKPAKTGAVSTPLSALSAGPAKKSLVEEKAELEAKIKKYEDKKKKAEERIKEIDESIKAEKPAPAAPSPATGSLEYFQEQLKKFKGTKYEAAVQEEIEKLLHKRMGDEIKTNMADPVKVKKFIDMVAESKKESRAMEHEIMKMTTSVPIPPKWKKADFIEAIREMVTDPVDVMKLRLDKRNLDILKAIYTNTVARYEWYKKNRPGQHIDFNIR